jgi:thiosulfate/3-mercaptopyruvate sulfurtransferase
MSDVTREELERRLGEEGLVLLDVRSPGEFSGQQGYPCDARQGHLPGASSVDLQAICATGDTAAVQALVGAPAGSEVIVYCHSGSRSAIAAELLRAAGYEARNYPGSWHEWAGDPALPIESP